MNLIFDTTNQALFLEKIDVDIYLEKTPILNDVYDILVEALCDSTTYKPGHIFKIAYALCGYTMKHKHPEECFPEMKQLLLSYDDNQLLGLILATTLVLLTLYRSPDHPTDMKIQRMSMLIKQNLSRASSYNADKLVHLANTYANSRIYADLDFKQHEDFIIEAGKTELTINISKNQEEYQECFEKAESRLHCLKGIFPGKAMAIMKPEEHEQLVEYVRYFIQTGSIPMNVKKIKAIIGSIYFLRYCFYLIYSDLKGSIAQYTAEKWIELLFAVFTNFDIANINTHLTKFSQKPDDYEKTVELIEKSLSFIEHKHVG